LSTTPEARKEHPLVGYLKNLVERGDRGSLAALRRGLGKRPGESPEMYPHVMRFEPKPWEEESYFLVASLFALWHQGSLSGAIGSTRGSIGESFRRVQDQSDSESIERRFVALLNAHREDLPEHLRHAVSLMRSAKHPVSINWDRLLGDLRNWDDERRNVQRRWARDFWGQPGQPNGESGQEGSETS
jgi:CRISPR system Cascade subunit CasB